MAGGTKRRIKKAQGYDVMPIKQAFEEFVAEKEATNLSPSTLKNYRQSVEYFFDFIEATDDTPCEEIIPSYFYQWMNSMKLDGVKHTSINHYLRDTRAFVYWCMNPDRAYIPNFKVPLMEGQEEQIKLFTDEELEALLEKPRRNDSFVVWRTWAIVNWVLGTGNRASTICEVSLTDINYAKKEITLAHTKNKKAQIIPLSSSLDTVLKEYIRMWRKEAPVDGWLFPNVGEEQLTTNALRHAFAKYCEERGVSRTNIHGLRHNFAKGWVRNNGNMFALQQILGHSTLDMTRKYVKMFSEDIKDDFDKFNPLDTIKSKSRRTMKVKRNGY